MSHLVSKALTKWTSPSRIPFPSHQCCRIISRYLNSDALFNEINSSFAKLKQKQSAKIPNISESTKASKPIKGESSKRSIKSVSAKSISKSRSSNKEIIRNGSVSLIGNDQKPISALKQRDENYLNRIKSLNSENAVAHKSMFDKYGTAPVHR